MQAHKGWLGVTGLEPANNGSEVRCLTTWRHPSKICCKKNKKERLAPRPGFEPGYSGLTARALAAQASGSKCWILGLDSNQHYTG